MCSQAATKCYSPSFLEHFGNNHAWWQKFGSQSPCAWHVLLLKWDKRNDELKTMMMMMMMVMVMVMMMMMMKMMKKNPYHKSWFSYWPSILSTCQQKKNRQVHKKSIILHPFFSVLPLPKKSRYGTGNTS